jgi:hypothetical protein
MLTTGYLQEKAKGIHQIQQEIHAWDSAIEAVDNTKLSPINFSLVCYVTSSSCHCFFAGTIVELLLLLSPSAVA